MNDALGKLYDIPIDRIASKLLWKSPSWAKIPLFERTIISEKPPRIKPEDVTNVFSDNVGNFKDRIGKRYGKYIVVGFAHAKDEGVKVRGGSDLNRPGWLHFAQPRRRRLQHRKTPIWWVMSDDGEVQMAGNRTLDRLEPSESFEEAAARQIKLRQICSG